MVRVKRGQWPPHGLDFTVNGSSFHCPYYLMDGIYPCYSLLVSPHPNRTTPQERTFNRLQEAICKDVERSHAVLTARFQMALRPARSTHVSTLIRTAKAIAILHNITTEQRRSGYVSRSRSGFGEGDMAAGAADDATDGVDGVDRPRRPPVGGGGAPSATAAAPAARRRSGRGGGTDGTPSAPSTYASGGGARRLGVAPGRAPPSATRRRLR